MKIIIKILIVVIISLAANIERGYSIAPFATVEHINVIDNLKAIEMDEVWKDVKGYEGMYQVSNLGKVRSLERLTTHNHKVKERILVNIVKPNGYLSVSLYVKAKISQVSVHRLVAIAFIDNPENKPQVNHKDGIKTNNNVYNLEWCTSKENIVHSYKNGLQIPIKRFGKDNNRSKAVEQYTLDNEYVNTFGSTREAQRKTGVNYRSICSCANGDYKHAGNYLWKFKE